MSTTPNLKPAKPELPPAPRSVRWLRGALAACILLIMGSTILNFHYWSKATEAKIEVQIMQQKLDSLNMQLAPASIPVR